MLRLKVPRLGDNPDASLQKRVQMAINLEFSTLPPYLYAILSIRPRSNAPAARRIRDIVGEEMIHMGLACNILNAIGGRPAIASSDLAAPYPRPLPGDIGSESTEEIWQAQLLPFSREAMAQGMHIEEPEDGPIEIPETELAFEAAVASEPEFQTIGQFYQWLDRHLARLPEDAWQPNRNQITDTQFFAGELFAINGYEDAHRAIQRIVSQGEGSQRSPLDFEGDLAHFYRFEEIERDQVLTRADNEVGYVWGEPLGVDWNAVFPAIATLAPMTSLKNLTP